MFFVIFNSPYHGLPKATGNIFPLKNLCPVKAKPAINSAICYASTGAL